MKTALVLGAGGFIGSHMVKQLKSEGYWVRGVDIKYPDFSKSEADEFLIYDLTDYENVNAVMRLSKTLMFSYLEKPFDTRINFDEVYQFAADMGGAGYVFSGDHDIDIMTNSALINLHVCVIAPIYKVSRLFYSSSACMYPQEIQVLPGSFGLRESDAYPANPDSEYGWEKLFSERLYLACAKNKGIKVRIARFHNIFGIEGTYDGGKEKAPAAICRKVVEAETEIEIWGDGQQTRSFLYIDECIEGVRRLMESDHQEPINIGSDESVSINKLAEMIIEMSGKKLTIKHIEGAIGVAGRNSDNNKIEEVLGWKPSHKLVDGITKTYNWIKEQMK
jgi:nucleoside-diphosphate-sugar epimerase